MHRSRCVTRTLRTQRGFILLPVVLAIVLIATIAFLLNSQSAINVDSAAGEAQARQTDAIAAAGLAHAQWGAQNSGCAGDMAMTTVPFGQGGTGSYTATVTTPGGGTTAYPNQAADQDAWFRSDNITNNNGGQPTLHLRREAGNLEYAVVRFDLSSLPAGSQINSALVRLYVKSGAGHPQGPVTVHRVTADWTETGATWETMGDKFDSAVLQTIPAQPVAGDNWVEVNLTAQVQAWVNGGEANYGIMLIPTGEGTHAEYMSRDDTSFTRPRLDVIVGTGPATPMTISATGTLTGNPSPAGDITRTLTHTDVPAWQPPGERVFQPGTEGTDTYIYEWKPGWNYGASTEIWAENRYANSIATGLLRFDLASVPLGARVTSALLELYQTNNSLNGGPIGVHRVTSAWVEGTGNGANGSPNWTQRVAGSSWTSAGGDYDAAAFATTTVPAGTGWSTWDIAALVNGWVTGEFANEGLALVAETFGTAAHFASGDATDPTLRPKLTLTFACECGSPCLAPQGTGTVGMVVVDPTTLVPSDAYKKALFEAWGYTVNLIGENTNAAGYNAAAASNDVFYISETVNSSQVGTRIKDVPIGVVSEDGDYNSALGLASGSGHTVGAALNVTDTSHYITAPFPTGPLDIYAAAMEQLTVSGTAAPGLQQLADTGGAGSLVVLDKGADMAGGGTTAGRRVMLPLGRVGKFNWDYLNGNGRLLVQRALQWGTGTGTVACSAENAADDFETGDYAGDTGTIVWNGAWQEFGESDGPDAGDFTVVANALCTSGRCLQIREDRAQSRQIMREVDLSGAVSASLSFSYRWRQTDIAGSVTLEASGDGGASFTPVKVYTFDTSTVPLVDSVDISAFIGAATQIRFSTSNTANVTALYVDDLDIVTSCAPAPLLTPLAHWKLDETSGSTAVDSVGGHDGTLTNGPGWTTGQDNGALDFDGSDDYVDLTSDAELDDVFVGGATVMAWINPASWGNNGYGRIFDKSSSSSSTGDGWALRLNKDNGGLNFGQGFTSGRGWWRFAEGAINFNTWHHVALAYDASSTANDPIVYLDGSPVTVTRVDTPSGSVLSDAAINLHLGNHASSAATFFEGKIDDARIYDSMLSAAEVADIAAGGGGGGGGGPPSGVVFEEFTDASLGSNGTSLTISKPAGTAAGDLLIAAVATDGKLQLGINPPAGWNLINFGIEAEQVSLAVWWKIAGAGEPASYNFTWAEDEAAYGLIMRFTGHDPANPINVSANAGGTSSSPTSPAVTTTVTDTMILRIGGFDDDDASAGDPGLPGHTAITMGRSGPGNGTTSAGAGYLIQATAGTSGTSTFSLTATEEYRSVTIGIAPAP